MKIYYPNPSVLNGPSTSPSSGAPAPGPQPGTPAPSIATTLPAATQLGSQVSTGAAPSLAPTHGTTTLKTEVS
jgi:hypothetical protein